jgi:hypothetical protein
LNTYLSSTCYTLLGVSEKEFTDALHLDETQKMLITFASEKNHRAILVYKVEEAKQLVEAGESTTIDTSGQQLEDDKKAEEEKTVEIKFSLKVAY